MGEACLINVPASASPAELNSCLDCAPPWFALKVRARSEPMASTALQFKGYVCFTPTYSERTLYSDRVRVVERPVFPGYVFCRLPQNFSKADIVSSPAVQYVVSIAGAPAAVPESEIEAIRRAVAAGGYASPYLPIGELIEITSGSLSGVQGVLLRQGKKNHIVVSVNLLQRSVAVEVQCGHFRLTR